MLSSLSHDLRTPLAGIEAAANRLLDEGIARDDQRRGEMARTILDDSRRMSRMVANLLDMVRLETGALEVQRELQPLEEVIGVALIRLGDRLGGRDVITRLPPDLPPVPIDGLLIEQVFINLIENAVEHAPGATPIEISARADRQAVTVDVADQGPGLPEGKEGLVFEKFYRTRDQAPGAGAGLGLTISRGIVAAHGGRIWADNRPGGGAFFRFTLPLGERAPAEAAPPAREAASVEGPA
jgi:two-component system sensor histidine kinase KdpD